MDRSADRPFVTLNSLTAGYDPGHPVLVDLEFTVSGPAIVLIAGANGSGKSTLVDVLSGYLLPWAGSVSIAGRPAHDPGARASRRVCRTQPAVLPALTARDHLDFACRLSDSPLSSAVARAVEYGLGPWLDREVADLSTGSVRKLWLLSCTMGRPLVTVLDEPFNGLDRQASAILVEEIRRWARDQVVLVVAHDPPDDLPIDREIRLPTAHPRQPDRATVNPEPTRTAERSSP